MKKRIQKIITNPLFSGSVIMVIGSNGVSFLNYLYHLAMGRMLGPAGYGELAVIISLIGLLGIIPGSLNLVVIKYISAAKNEDDGAAIISWFKARIFWAALIFSFFVLLISPVISSFLHISNIYYLIFVSVSFLFGTLSLLNRSILQGLLKFKYMVISILIENVIKLGISILLVYIGFQIGGAVVGFVIAVVLGWYITNRFLQYHNKRTDVKINFKQIFSFIIPVLVQSIAITSLISSDLILVKHFFSSHDAGIYAALSTLGKIIFFASGPIGAVMFPLVSRKNARGENYKKIFVYSFLATILLSTGVLLVYWLYPSLAIKLLFGSKYLEAQNLLVWFGIFMSLFTLSYLFVNYGLSLGRTSIVILPLIAAILQIVIIIFFHQTLFTVVIASIVSTALLLISLLIYSTYRRRL
ncbi:MAG: oligosaccharide flippase family protein [Actinobacteria bacterium]|nr:oligosaccharide flippase family protein [Actinomycetota bacterium]